MKMTPHVISELQQHTRIRPRKELALTMTFTAMIVIGFLAYLRYAVTLQFTRSGYGAVESLMFALIMIMLAYGVVVYGFSRIGYLIRLMKHHAATDDELDAFCHGSEDSPTLTILIPSFKEEPRTVYQTLFSAAVQQYPNKRIVLLLDDPPDPTNEKDRRILEQAIRHVTTIQQLVTEEHEYLRQRIDHAMCLRGHEIECERAQVLEAYDHVIGWFTRIKNESAFHDHTDALFATVCFKRRIQHLQRRRRRAESAQLTRERVLTEYRCLASNFSTTITYFQRRRYANLSHESNKAMNLNSYIHLMGARWKEELVNDEKRLVRTERDGFTIPDSDFLITLDADSIVSHDYAIRLLHYIEQPGRERIAVIQTPYSAVPNAKNMLERLAGATTDIQYIIHQGFTWCNATYWVGANAVLRKRALHDIETVEQLASGDIVRKFVSDTTVIEDTESSIDLIRKGWTLFNYPRRLSFSATPQDFGSLLIQRRRWANGGLIILPKLLAHLSVNAHRPHYSVPSGFFRLHYLISLTTANLGTLFLLFYPFRDGLLHYSVVGIALAYYFLYGRDLHQIGYKASDTLRVYALNLMLVPVNLGGIIMSIRQMVLQKKVPFSRTPKVGSRTVAPRFYLVLLLLFPLSFAMLVVSDTILHNWFHGAFSLVNTIAFGYALWLTDPKQSLRELLRKEARHPVHFGWSFPENLDQV
jgi:cellulose synthase/poly-beta-1,6-N-acetylglucosamine synthase-like glycosyltransferase